MPNCVFLRCSVGYSVFYWANSDEESLSCTLSPPGGQPNHRKSGVPVVAAALADLPAGKLGNEPNSIRNRLWTR